MSSAEYRRAPFVERELAHGRRLVHPLDTPMPTQLSGSAPLIWDLLESHPTVDAVVAMLQQQFSDPPDVIADGVRTAITAMMQGNLVVES